MASPNDTVYVQPGATLTDPAGNQWNIQNGQVYENGVVDAGTSNVDAIALVNGDVWQQAIPSWSPTALWWAKTGGPGSYDGWTSGPGTNNSNGTPTSPLSASPDGTTLVSGASSPLVDSQGNLWWISGGQVVENGQPDAGTSNVIEMEYQGGYVWQEAEPSWSSVPLWWAKTGGPGNFDGWTSGPGTDNANGSLTGPGIVRTWIGGGDNLASDPADWSPTGAPQPGDTLNVTGITTTINFNGNDLAGDPLNIMNGATVAASVSGAGNPPPTQSETFNLSNSSLSLRPETGIIVINMSGTDTFGYNSSGPSFNPEITINLAPNATWQGGFTLGSHYGGGPLTINGDSSTTFDNDGTSNLIFHDVDIPVPVSGTGSFDMGPGKLEFGSSVGAGQTVDVGTYPFASSVLQIDQPMQFLANVVLHGGSEGSDLLPTQIDLVGLATADGYTYQNDMLTIFSGNTPIDHLHLTDQTTNGFTVEKTASSVNILAITTNPIQMASAPDVMSLPNVM